MKKLSFLSILFSAAILMSCSSSSENNNDNETAYVALEKMSIESLESEIAKREKLVSEDSTGVDDKNAADLLEAYYVYADRFSNRANSADRLFKAAELAMSLNHTPQAIKYFERVYNDYKDYEKRPYALFLQAFVLENQAMEYDRATEIYKEFIKLYPNHPMADDAEYSMMNMGKSPEELIEEFERRDSLQAAQESAS